MRILIFTTSFLNKVGKFTSLFIYLDRSLTASHILKLMPNICYKVARFISGSLTFKSVPMTSGIRALYLLLAPREGLEPPDIKINSLASYRLDYRGI